MESPPLHVVFGYGQVGPPLVEAVLERNERARVVKRSPSEVPEGVELLTGDATDARFCREACRGAHAVYHCMNPAYETATWEKLLPVLQQNLVAAAGASEARLVVLENLYMVGRPDGPITAATPFDPCSRKGEIRAQQARELQAAHERGDARVVSGRASDFYGPRGSDTHFGEFFWPRVIQGRAAAVLFDPDTPHTYHFIDDVARGLLALATGPEDCLGRAWMLPCAPAESSRELVDRFAQELGQSIRLWRIPRLASRAVGIFMPMVREIGEMLHQWEVPFVVDDSGFREQFGLNATDAQSGAAATVAWARQAYAPS